MYCRHCGHENKDSDRFCLACGQALVEQSDQTIPDTERIHSRENSNTSDKQVISDPSSKKRKLPRIGLTILGLGLLLSLFLLVKALSVIGLRNPFQMGRLVGYAYSENGSGLIDSKGKTILDFQYENISFPSEGRFSAKDFMDQWKIFDLNGKTLAEIEGGYYYIGEFSEGLAYFWDYDEKYGYMDSKGKIVIPAVFDEADSFLDGVALVEKNNQYLLINKRGDILDSFEDGYIIPFTNGYNMYVPRDEMFPSEIMDRKGKVIFTGHYGWGGYLGEDRYLLIDRNNSSSYIVNKKGEVIKTYPQGFADCEHTEGILIEMLEYEQYRYTNLLTGQIFDEIYNYAETFKDGYAVAALDGKFRIIDPQGEMVLDCRQYTDVQNAGYGYFLVESAYERILINAKGKVIKRYPLNEVNWILFFKGEKNHLKLISEG